MGARTVEWMREHGFGPMVNSVERWWYTKNEPKVGGVPEHGLPEVRDRCAAQRSGASRRTSRCSSVR
jgi:hypothetical protein